jgi:hypothetical protein
MYFAIQNTAPKFKNMTTSYIRIRITRIYDKLLLIQNQVLKQRTKISCSQKWIKLIDGAFWGNNPADKDVKPLASQDEDINTHLEHMPIKDDDLAAPAAQHHKMPLKRGFTQDSTVHQIFAHEKPCA